MKDVIVLKDNEIVKDPLVGGDDGHKAGWRKRIVYPQNVATKGSYLGIAEVNPGFSPHRWHGHTGDRTEEFEIVYPDNFEEINYIISGTGVVQWKDDDGKVLEKELGPGDTVYFPVGVADHQVLNKGTEPMVVLFCGYPTVEVVPFKK